MATPDIQHSHEEFDCPVLRCRPHPCTRPVATTPSSDCFSASSLRAQALPVSPSGFGECTRKKQNIRTERDREREREREREGEREKDRKREGERVRERRRGREKETERERERERERVRG